MDNEQYIESGLSVGTTKIANKYEIFTEEEVDIINNKIPELDERVSIIEYEIEDINSSLDNKANLNSIFNMANMGQDVKEAMTNGSVAVVGRNAVLTENIVDEQVTPEKLSIFEKTKENLWVIDSATYKGMSVNYSYEDFSTKFKGEFIETSRMLLKTVHLSIGTWSIKTFELTGNKPTIYVYKMDDYLKSNWSAYVGLLARANYATNIAIESNEPYCIVVYGEGGEMYESNGKFVLSKKPYDDVDEFIPNTYTLKDYINVPIKNENIPIGSITAEKTDFVEKTTDNIWEFDNLVDENFSIKYSFENGVTQFLGSVSEITRFLIKQTMLNQGSWSIKAFDYTGLKPTIYIYKKTDYDKQNWNNFICVLKTADYKCDFNIVDSGEYCLVAYVAVGSEFNYNAKIVLSQNNSENVTSYTPIKYRFKGYVEPIKNENIPIGSITAEKTDFVEKTTDNIWEFDNLVDENFSIKYSFENGTTYFLGSVSTIKRCMFKQVHLTSGVWCIKSFDYSGFKPSIYIYKKSDYEDSKWQNYVGILAKAGYGCNFDITDDGEYCLVAFTMETEEYNYSGKIVLSKNNYENIDKYIPIKYKFKSYVDVEEPTEETVLFKELQGKKLSILGVSIDTYKDYIVSENSTYYTSSNLPSVEMTWWKKLLNKTGMVLDVNNSWSGACASTKTNLLSSGVQRCTNLGENPDFIIISAFALNDWANSNLTPYDKDGMLIPDCNVDLSITENYTKYQDTIESYGGALATIFYRIMEKYHDTKIFVCDAYNYYRNGKVPFTPEITEPKINICNEILYDVARQFGIEVIKVSECGINAFNSKKYCVETNVGIGLHPNDEGHTLYFKKVLDGFVKYI